jgi:hypothetical protein
MKASLFWPDFYGKWKKQTFRRIVGQSSMQTDSLAISVMMVYTCLTFLFVYSFIMALARFKDGMKVGNKAI